MSDPSVPIRPFRPYRPIRASSAVEALLSTAADLVRRSRRAFRLHAQAPGLRPSLIHGWLRADSGAADFDNGRVLATMTARGVPFRMFGAFDPEKLRADARAAARRASAASLPVFRRFLSLALVAVLMITSLATVGATALQAAAHALTPDPQSAVTAAWAAAEVRELESSTADHRGELQVHVQAQASLRAGGERQFRLAVDESSSPGTTPDATAVAPLLVVDLAVNSDRSGDGSVSVAPTQLVVTRDELNLTPIWVEVSAHAPCGSDTGDLHVRVRELGSGGRLATTTVALPPVDCRAAPPAVGERR